MRTSTSSSSLTLRSCSIARRRVFMSWLATAARPVSSSPESTRSVRSSSSVFTWGSSLLALPLPPFDAARRRFSAFLGSCQKQYSCGGSTVAVHLPPSRFIPAHVAIKYVPPYPSRLRAVGAGAGQEPGMNGKKHGGCSASARGQSTLRQAPLEDVPHT